MNDIKYAKGCVMVMREKRLQNTTLPECLPPKRKAVSSQGHRTVEFTRMKRENTDDESFICDLYSCIDLKSHLTADPQC